MKLVFFSLFIIFIFRHIYSLPLEPDIFEKRTQDEDEHVKIINKLRAAFAKNDGQLNSIIELDAETQWELGRMHIVHGNKSEVPSIYRPWDYVRPEQMHGNDEILLPEDLEALGLDKNVASKNEKRKFVYNVGSPSLWTNGVVYYKFADASSGRQFQQQSSRDKVLEAMRWYEQNSCITFQQATTQASYAEIGGGSGCSSHVGMHRKTEITLQESYCLTLSTVLHEIGHTLGMHHEHVRNDRNDHLTINWNLLSEGPSGTNWGISNTYNMAPYDMGSNMHYSLYAGSSDRTKMAMVPKDMELAFLAGFTPPSAMTFFDLKALNKAYQCSGDCSSPPSCQNTAFVDFKCQCRCPEHLTGSTCNQIETDSGCGGIIDVNSQVSVSSPGHPSNYASGKECTWLFRGVDGAYLTLDFQEFDIPDGGLTYNGVGEQVQLCLHFLEIQYNLVGQPGPKYCGSNWQRGSVKTSRFGETNLLMLRFNSKAQGSVGKGFKATVTSDKQGSNPCSGVVCQNGGQCVANGGSFQCNCASGYSGTYCENSSGNPCASVNCQNGGNCVNGQCNCPSGYTGTFCENQNDPCASITCQNGGNCVNGQCNCPSGYTGTFCENQVTSDPCASITCQNSGFCFSGTCYCISGYTGTYCENQEGDSCASINCQNGGNCVNGQCNCPSGYTGTFCENQNDPCASINCQNGGNCVNGQCNCPSGYTGTFCENQSGTSGGFICSFDGPDMCGFQQATDFSDDFDFELHTGSSPSFQGASGDHTGNGYYLLAQQWGGHKANLDSPVVDTSHGMCLQFWYHIVGYFPSKLHVVVRGLFTGSNTNIFTSDGTSSNQWRRGRVRISASSAYRVRFTAEVNFSNSDVALDDIKLTSGSC